METHKIEWHFENMLGIALIFGTSLFMHFFFWSRSFSLFVLLSGKSYSSLKSGTVIEIWSIEKICIISLELYLLTFVHL